VEQYHGGCLFMALPSGRLLTYPNLKWRTVPILDEEGHKTGKEREELTFRRAYGRVRLWRGVFCENGVQAVAADILRGTVRRLEEDEDLAWMKPRGHTHDEVLVETEESHAGEAAAVLRRHMLMGFDWSEGLPLESEETASTWYSKAKPDAR
jgi:hypothetical protein